MRQVQRGSTREDRARSASSLSADLPKLVRVVRRTGYVLARLHELVMAKITADDDIELAERLNDELKPLIDGLLHFEVSDGSP